MGWWWLSLMLVMSPWLSGNPGIQAGPPGLWQWVVLASWLPGVHPCLLCFSSPLQWTNLCHGITGAPANHSLHRQCLEAIAHAALPLASVTVGLEQHKTLEETMALALKFLEYAEGLVPACIPPCGYQPAASVFKCATCRFEHCPFPLDCPVQDKWVQEDEAITLLCNVPFTTPTDTAVTWMFAKDLRTQDLVRFEELQGSVSGPFSLTIQEPVPGTVACCLGPVSQPLVRKYFYINGPSGNAGGSEVAVTPRHPTDLDNMILQSVPNAWIHPRGA
ncbi:sperm acrosome membrane-associated protein 6 [Indicator indicator]|uniref:sperm acrosome membrane-associated protein 6 n=1 Tax=Indicator indicator TaxID=1002788 RepID=UPI0023DE8A1C|nr:sperm acrosome membrane-associated protein 6 [Indicator indicator]